MFALTMKPLPKRIVRGEGDAALFGALLQVLFIGTYVPGISLWLARGFGLL